MEDARDSTGEVVKYGENCVSVPSEPGAAYQFVAVTAVTSLRLLAKRYGRPQRSGGVVTLPYGYEWDLAAEAIGQLEKLEGVVDAD